MKTRTMRAFTFKRYGKSPELGFENVDYPSPGADEILVKVYAVGLNPIDNIIPSGIFKPILHFKLPATLGSDLSGVVIATGSRVTRFKPGDEVFASIFDIGTGSLADFARIPERLAAFKPENLDFIEAASLPMVSLTAWQAFTERAHLRPGQKVFIPAGSGGIGTIAIQLAKHLGASVATTTSSANVEWVSRLGADEVIDYKKQGFEKVLSGYDLVLGTLRGDSIEKAMQILKPGGKILSLVGPLDVKFARARQLNILLRMIFVLMSRKIMRHSKKRGLDYSFLFVRPDGDQLTQIGKLIEAEHIKPVIDRVFPFADTKDALAYLEQGHAKGKVVVKIHQE
ncbi:NADP-dependent oxidoreductase [Pantoea agglomerans]|uniref:NADP-dependent oxidoreductase n=1 Tax=Enterobacter agglomerans TaxID=549 RepID=UPI0010BFC412|nr:NADP-dependent oxidoreductase [Pantoea agglomerans]MBD8143156.1 NADP-dependent oxidoreductase [Pantoea agglomerans]MBD8182092.1 NADP-dependent oxidoreductase [Pantoea agglomerans]MBD8222715.1 NADP-dependent oxidoreductase [Pantoea agglomerans]TKJ55958.1 NADPH:quinone oxidoreductase [Pantoea agglomerans]TKK18210.1 NADPH:quinone oxidoreductase [Pantoea agglomerans]